MIASYPANRHRSALELDKWRGNYDPNASVGEWSSVSKSSSLPSLRHATKASVRLTRGKELRFTRPLTLDQLQTHIARDAALLHSQSQVDGSVKRLCSDGASAVPSSMEDLAASLDKEHKDHPVRERLRQNIKKSQRWEALQKAWMEGDLPRLRAAIKSAHHDSELSSMPVVTRSEAALIQLAQITRHCDDALQAMCEGEDRKKQVRIIRGAVQQAEKLALGPKMWDDQILIEALDALDAEAQGITP